MDLEARAFASESSLGNDQSAVGREEDNLRAVDVSSSQVEVNNMDNGNDMGIFTDESVKLCPQSVSDSITLPTVASITISEGIQEPVPLTALSIESQQMHNDTVSFDEKGSGNAEDDVRSSSPAPLTALSTESHQMHNDTALSDDIGFDNAMDEAHTSSAAQSAMPFDAYQPRTPEYSWVDRSTNLEESLFVLTLDDLDVTAILNATSINSDQTDLLNTINIDALCANISLSSGEYSSLIDESIYSTRERQLWLR